jgi:Undecaprenyl-phosphate glucose phosphotransferase
LLRNLNLRRWWFKLSLFAAPTVVFLLSLYVETFRPQFKLDQIGAYSTLYLLLTSVWILNIDYFDVARFRPLPVAIRKTIKANAYTGGLVFAFAFFYRSAHFPRLFLASTVTSLLACSLLIQFFFHKKLPLRIFQTARPRIAVLGADQYALRVANRLRKNHLLECEIAGFVALPGQTSAVCDEHAIDWNSLHDVVDEWRCKEVVLALPPRRLYKLESLRPRLQELYLPVRLILDFGRDSFSRESIHDVGGLSFLDVATDPTESVGYSVAKRAFDIAFALLVLLTMAPLMALIAVLVKLSSRGPVFFKQVRVGHNGREFDMLKFRTMREAPRQEGDTLWTTAADNRRTWIGALLRTTSLDELPQFLNVLKGDMSVVGPRPERPYFVQQFNKKYDFYNKRHNGKVGITGWAQVNGLRGDSSIQTRVEMDLFYLHNWSFAFDIRIIGLTLLKGMMGKNAY